MIDILLTTINAKWIHPSLALRLLKANLGELEERCEIIEFALRQPFEEKSNPVINAQPKILGVSVSIWNHAATIELLREICKTIKPVIVLGGPEVSHLPEDAKIFQYADYVIRGEGEIAFQELCEKILAGENIIASDNDAKFITADPVDVTQIKSAYHLYNDEDVAKKLIYVEASRGCVFNCEFCVSSIKFNTECAKEHKGHGEIREFPLEAFLGEIEILIKRGAKTLKFLDRSINTNIPRSIQIINFLLSVPSSSSALSVSFVTHFEMVPHLFTSDLIDALAKFPPNTLRLEIGIQTLNEEAAARAGLPSRAVLENLRLLAQKTNAIIHADLIAGLPGEDLASFAKGFDALLEALAAGRPPENNCGFSAEIQLGILKLLPGTPIARHNDAFGMRFNPLPPYEVIETGAITAHDMGRIKNFARFWEIIVNRGLAMPAAMPSTFNNFMELSDRLYEHFGRNWGIDRGELMEFANLHNLIGR